MQSKVGPSSLLKLIGCHMCRVCNVQFFAFRPLFTCSAGLMRSLNLRRRTKQELLAKIAFDFLVSSLLVAFSNVLARHTEHSKQGVFSIHTAWPSFSELREL